MIGPALTFLGVSAYWERAIQGAIILAAVSIDAVRVRSTGKTSEQHALSERRPWRERCFPNGEWVLPLALAVEIAIFAAIGENFFTLGEFLRGDAPQRGARTAGARADAGHRSPAASICRSGSMMGLAAVVFGALWRDGGFPIAARRPRRCSLGCRPDALNAVLITRLNLPPLIVTLGSFSLFRGIAEGITQGAVNYSGFPRGVSAFWARAIWAAWCRCSFRFCWRPSRRTGCCCTAR